MAKKKTRKKKPATAATTRSGEKLSFASRSEFDVAVANEVARLRDQLGDGYSKLIECLKALQAVHLGKAKTAALAAVVDDCNDEAATAVAENGKAEGLGEAIEAVQFHQQGNNGCHSTD